MLFVDVKYADLLMSRVALGKRKEEYLWNYRCPVCGDSTKNKNKARGYIYRVKMGLFAKCHNCGFSSNLGNLIKHVDISLYEEYALERYKEGGAPRSSHTKPKDAIPEFFRSPTTIKDDILRPLSRIDRLPTTHPAVRYVIDRKIPSRFLSLLYFAPKFNQFVNSIIPNKLGGEEHPRLIIPYFTPQGVCFGFQGRAFGKEDPKYITIKVDESREKIFGLERINFAKHVYIFEGPLDSLFIPNALAVSGSSFTSPIIEELKQRCTVVYDNEPRSKELCNLIKKTIDIGFSVCLWPDTIQEKDVNDMVLAGRTQEDVLDIINHNTYNGADALLKFAMWRKC